MLLVSNTASGVLMRQNLFSTCAYMCVGLSVIQKGIMQQPYLCLGSIIYIILAKKESQKQNISP